MGETKQISVPVPPPVALRFAYWCKINNMTQAEGLLKLILENVPEIKITVKEVK